MKEIGCFMNKSALPSNSLMPTKRKRRYCILCKRYQVDWKMPSFGTMSKLQSAGRIYFCWKCAKHVADSLSTLDLNLPPVRKKLLKQNR